MSPYHGSEESTKYTDSSGNGSWATSLRSILGRFDSNSMKTRDFFALEVVKTKSNFLRTMIHLEYDPPIIFQDRMCRMGFSKVITIVCHSNI